jgi:SAM-dependent methyltransferase
LPHTVSWQCRADSCGLRFASPQLSDQELARAYSTHYYPPADDSHSIKYEDTPHLVARQVLSQLESSLGSLKGLRLLDYGCGRGPLSSIALELGFVPMGIEPDPVARNFTATRFGVPVYANLEELRSRGSTAQFDLILIWNVIEHLRQPWSDLRELRALLCPGGQLLIGTMNVRCLRARIERARWMNYRNPTHFYYFDRRSLERVIASGGFAQVREWRPKIRYPGHSTARHWLYEASSLFRLSDGLFYLCSSAGCNTRG